ncbi:hypothetical protein DL768_008787 [Monosporascus sp. mg162]|nr:hypothetical protein DL768_008787 [Monosporascus sp. mg162]
MSVKSFRYLPLDPERRGASSSSIPGNTVLLDGHPFPVTTNLLTALRHLRPPTGAGATALWVDAVCINQQGLDERRHQVTMMRDIYASAERVIIWLGVEDDETDDETDVFDSLSLLATQSHRKGIDSDRDQHLVDLIGAGFLHKFTEITSPFPSPCWAFRWPEWPTERGVARQKEQQGGNQKLPGGDVTGENPGGPGGGDIEVLEQIKIDILDDLYTAVKSQGGESGESLCKLLKISRSSEVTDPRDCIYALLSLLKPGSLEAESKDAITVDYRKSTSEVYADTMAYIFAQEDGPYFLSGVFLPGVSAPAPHIHSLPSTARQPDLPSWVPDFSRQVGGKATQPSGTMFHPPAVPGGGASGAGAGCKNGGRLGDGRTLQIEGLFVDTIEQVVLLGPTLDAYIAQLPELESLASAAKQRPCQLGSSVKSLVDEFKSKEPLWRALIGDKRFLSGYDPAPSSYEATYLSLLSGRTKQRESDHETVPALPSEYEQYLGAKIGDQSFFTTRSGFVGTCVPDSRRGDITAVLFGSPVPFVLRPAAESIQVAGSARPSYLLIEASYVSGIMNGEMVDELYCDDLMDSMTFFIW